jgi:hypothetical protein
LQRYDFLFGVRKNFLSLPDLPQRILRADRKLRHLHIPILARLFQLLRHFNRESCSLIESLIPNERRNVAAVRREQQRAVKKRAAIRLERKGSSEIFNLFVGQSRTLMITREEEEEGSDDGKLRKGYHESMSRCNFSHKLMN